MSQPEDNSFLARVVDVFLRSDLPPLLILLSLIAGAVALVATPREEEPQIVVPMADVLVEAPGLSPSEVERQIATPLEKLLSEIDGVEYVYSMSRASQRRPSSRPSCPTGRLRTRPRRAPIFWSPSNISMPAS